MIAKTEKPLELAGSLGGDEHGRIHGQGVKDGWMIETLSSKKSYNSSIHMSTATGAGIIVEAQEKAWVDISDA